MSIVKGEFKNTGINEIDIDLTVSRWNHLWVLTEWRADNSWKVVKYIRKDSQNRDLKLMISPNQANELINKLGLIAVNTGFRSSFSWRTKEDIEMLEKYRREKYAEA